MTAFRIVTLLFALAGFAIAPFSTAGAETDKTKPPKTNPVGVGSSWSADVDKPSTIDGRVFDEAELAIIKQINDYFNGLTHLKGQFVQVDAEKKQATGTFVLWRPGRFRFDYAPPNKLVILADGHYLWVEDHELRTKDAYPIEDTPFRILLSKTVDILRDSKVLDIVNEEDTLAITLKNKGGDDVGAIRLVFNKTPKFELKAWVVTDAQGLNTRVAVADLIYGEEVDAKKFRTTKFGFEKLPGGDR